MELNIEKILQRGIKAHKAGELEKAERLYQSILQSQPANPDANHNLGVLAVSVNQINKALSLFKTALEANPNIEQFWLSYIDTLFKNKKNKKAKQFIEQAKKKGFNKERLNALEIQPAAMNTINKVKSTPQNKRLTFVEKQKKLVQAQKDKKNKSKFHTNIIPSRTELNKLFLLYQNNQFDDAENLAKSLTEKFPHHPFSWKVLGALLKQTGRISESLMFMQKSVQLAPQDAVAHSNLGVALKELGKLKEAEASYTKAIALKPDYAEAHSNLGITLKESGKLKEAEASYTKAITLKPNYAEAHNNLGNTLQELGRLEEAKESYTKSIGLKPNYTEAHSNLANTLQELGRLEEAESSYIRAITLNPNYADAYSNLGSTLKKLGRLDEAKASYKKAIALNPENSSAKHMLVALTGNTTKTAPRDYVEELFDNYAARFESSLIDKLEYEIPRNIAEMIIKESKSDFLVSIADLGCGTGLFGTEIIEICKRLEGVDISEKMLAEAKKKNIYNKLIKQDIIAYLSKTHLNFDYFVSTDVFVYIGDLYEVFRLIKSRNQKGGKLAFSTENSNGDSFFLEQSGRYSHSKKYIESLCKKFDYKLCHFETKRLRKEDNKYIIGGLYLLEF